MSSTVAMRYICPPRQVTQRDVTSTSSSSQAETAKLVKALNTQSPLETPAKTYSPSSELARQLVFPEICAKDKDYIIKCIFRGIPKD